MHKPQKKIATNYTSLIPNSQTPHQIKTPQTYQFKKPQWNLNK